MNQPASRHTVAVRDEGSTPRRPAVFGARLLGWCATALLLPLSLACTSNEQADAAAGDSEEPGWHAAEAPGWLFDEMPSEEYHYAVGELIFSDGFPVRDARERAAREAQEQLMYRLERLRPQIAAHLERLIDAHPEAEEQLRAEAEHHAEQNDLDEPFTPTEWLAERVWQYLLYVLANEAMQHEAYMVREADEIDEETYYYDGRTGERIEPSAPGPDRIQIFVLVGLSRQRLVEVFTQQVGIYGIELTQDEQPSYLQETKHR